MTIIDMLKKAYEDFPDNFEFIVANMKRKAEKGSLPGASVSDIEDAVRSVEEETANPGPTLEPEENTNEEVESEVEINRGELTGLINELTEGINFYEKIFSDEAEILTESESFHQENPHYKKLHSFNEDAYFERIKNISLEKILKEEEGKMEPCSKLIANLKVTSANIKTLHRNLVGGNWFADHEKLSEYYQKIDEMEDSVIESLLGLGYHDVPISLASQWYPIIEAIDREMKESLLLVQKWFTDLLHDFQEVKENTDLPDGVTSEFDDFEYYLFIETEYKITRWLNSNKEPL